MGGRGSTSGRTNAKAAGKNGTKAAAKSSKSFKPYSSKELKTANDSKLKESMRQLVTEYYKSGKSGISFGGHSIESVVDTLLSQKRSRASIIKDYKAIKKSLGYKD